MSAENQIMKTADLSGADLDYWVAMAQGWELSGVTWRMWIVIDDRGYYEEFGHRDDWHPSLDWEQGGPLIERERIAVVPYFDRWHAIKADLSGKEQGGSSPLIAAMRCYVTSKFGDDVSATA